MHRRAPLSGRAPAPDGGPGLAPGAPDVEALVASARESRRSITEERLVRLEEFFHGGQCVLDVAARHTSGALAGAGTTPAATGVPR
jgi:hypothetical protein